MALVGHLGDMFEILGAVFGISEAMLDEIGLERRKSSVCIVICEVLKRKSSGDMVASGGKWWQVVASGGGVGGMAGPALYCKYCNIAQWFNTLCHPSGAAD